MTPPAEMKLPLPRFGDLVENNSAGAGNPQKRGYFVRFIGRGSDRRWECTDGKGNFWQTYETCRGFPEHRITVIQRNRHAELVEALKELLEAEWMVTCDWASRDTRDAILAKAKALTEPATDL